MTLSVDQSVEFFVLRILAITTALLLTFFISGTVDYSPRIDDGAAYTAFVDYTTYTSQKQDDKKFLPQKEFVLNSVQVRFFNFTPRSSSVVGAIIALKIRDPPSVLAS
jgi:hypothetical protein